MNITSYGLHWAPGNIPFLVQATGVQNLISPDLGNPFTLDLPMKNIKCPHAIDLNSDEPEPDWLQDPLAQALLPIPSKPGGSIKMLHDPHGRYAQLAQDLVRLSSPTEPTIQPIWWKTSYLTRRRYMATNLTPLVWMAVEMRHMDRLIEHCEMTAVFQRNTVILARDNLPLYRGVEWLQTELTRVPDGDLEAIGAGALRRWMANDEARSHAGVPA